MTATELRKKLAQYYYEDGHSDEIRIKLPPGSYLPRFRRSLKEDATAADQPPEPLEVVAATVDVPPDSVEDKPGPKRHPRTATLHLGP